MQILLYVLLRFRLFSWRFVDAAISADSGAKRGERDGPAVGGDSELEGDVSCICCLLALLLTLTVHCPPHCWSPSTTGVVGGCAAPSSRRSSGPRSGSDVDGPGGMSGDVLLPPLIGGVATATHGDVSSSPMVGRILVWGRLGGVVSLPTPPVKPVDVMGLPQVVVVTVQVVSVAGSDVAGETDVRVSPRLPDGLPLMVGDRLGSLAGGVLSDWPLLV